MRTKILNHFKKNDSKIAPYIGKVLKERVIESKNESQYFERLCRSIIYQQISGKAGDAILKKFINLFPKKKISAKRVLLLKDVEMRKAGISPQKAKYLKSLAEHFIDKKIKTKDFLKMSGEEIVAELTKVKGIGRWTAEMFIMFTLGREDVFSFGDLGLKNGFKKVYGFKNYPTEKQVERIIKKWSPYKTYGALALWKSLE